jgi:hypothetical protein
MTHLTARLRLTALWAALMFLYVYADIFSFYQPGELEEAIAGKLGPYDVTQTSLFLSALLMALPAAMLALTPLLPTALCRWANVVMGALYTVVNIGNVVGESWAYYLFYGGLETILTVSIAVFAYLWLRPGASAA